ncbi:MULTISPECIES: DegQ family serine endoprotease [Aromatoleum]|uniref:Probable periplasmic serine endoprotease DegP-like n=2 Tax=Aromatoleum TaxID=551759 RepID=A0ABX1NQ28_9RHOO|nr:MULTISPECIES: DegQ family serine endoprotease [Aromatoleum]MCK0507549.1 DegQ family serine endoprotease [Aromatoleum anaerobium]NMG14003.1 Do family serine endopeptidase [Aromatoleum bremense]QTQ31822.1 Periplasmic serine endoprotease [Aromatoleum bremense]
MRNHPFSRPFVVALAAIVPAAIGLLPSPQAFAAAESVAPLVAPNSLGLPDFGDLVERVGPAVVNISVVQERAAPEAGALAEDPFYDFLRRFGVPLPGMPGMPGNGSRGPQISRGIGSGFIVSADGYVLTNAHVVGAGEDGVESEVTVRLIDKREFKAKVVGTDPRTDIALLKIDASGLPVVRTGNADKARVGEWVVAVGSPFGFDNTVTAGIISAKARRLPDENYVPFIQTDVAINPGNSGGPLFNLTGEVIGINSQIYSRSGGFMGISFAIPIDVALNVKDQIIKYGRVQRGKLGVTIQGMTRELAQSFGLAEPKGALVSNVEPGGAADKAGIKAGDVVLGVNGTKIEESGDLPRIIGDKRPGSEVKLELWRDGRTRTVTATLGEMRGEAVAEGRGEPGGPQGEDAGGKIGLVIRPLTAEEAALLGVRGGIVIERAAGPAQRAGLQRGDVILALNNQPVSDIASFRALIEKAGDRFALLIQRGGARIFVPMRVN